MRPRRGTAIKPDASADLLLPRSPAARHRQAAPLPDAGRFSPLNAPQRALLEDFLAEARPWAMRQARRGYRHLPAELHEQAYDQTVAALRSAVDPSGLDRRKLYGVLAERLDEELRRIHVGWCLNHGAARGGSRTGPAAPLEAPAAAPLTAFLEEGLGGLERAVLQLEIGAGRNTHTVRAALRLGPRQYARHRELGLAKLRGAITGGLRGQVCDQHLDAVTLAATGDRSAADQLASGPSRCRSCAREAAGLARVLQQRLALAPWPFAIKPAGLLVAKLGAAGALFGGKTAGGVGGAGLAGTGSSVKIVAALVASAAVATGGIAAVEPESGPAGATSAATARTAAATATTAPVPRRAATTTATAEPRRARSERRRRAARRERPRPETRSPVTTTAPAEAAPAATAPAAPAARPLEPVRETVGGVRRTVDRVKAKLPVKTPPVVDQVTDGLDRTVDDVTGVLDSLLAP